MSRRGKPLHRRLYDKGKNSGKDNTDYKGPHDIGTPCDDASSISQNEGCAGTADCDGTELYGRQPVNVFLPGILSGKNNMEGNTHRTHSRQDIPAVKGPCTVRTEEEETDDRQKNPSLHVSRNGLSKDECTDNRHQHHIQPRQKCRI